ncbi:hypothetical protein ACS0TY_000684 [Phlomoides rotata]
MKKTLELVSSIGIMGPEIAINLGKPTSRFIKWDASVCSWEEHEAESEGDCPSDTLVLCLNSIEDALQQNDDFITERNRPFYANPWGFEFWSYYVSGKDVLEVDVSDSKIEKIAWITATAADTISTMEDEGVSFNGPFLLYLVPSLDKVHEVFRVCKPLMIAGIYAFTLHSNASVDHQIQSLKSSEPEFLISTPERLLELLPSKAVDLSDLSLMVIDGLEAPFEDTTYLDAVKSIRQFISVDPQTVVFCDCKNDSSMSACK